MRCRELDIFKILGIFCECLEIFRIFFRNCCGIFGGIIWRKCLREIFLEDFLVRIFLEDFFEGLLGGFFWEEFLMSSSLFTLELTCLSRFWFLSRFWGNAQWLPLVVVRAL